MHCEDCVAEKTSEGEHLLSIGSGGQTWDDVRGGWLDHKLVSKARSVEMEYVRNHEVYTRVARS
eukprot:15970172-Heterocapsa_arctica.AAC.1